MGKIRLNNTDKQLINLVKVRPALYDTRLPKNERSKIVREVLWQEISDNLRGKLESHEAEARWKYLRENYIRARKTEQTKEEFVKQSGVKLKNKQKKYSFRYYEIMEFLNDALDYQKMVTANNVEIARRALCRTPDIQQKVKLTSSALEPLEIEIEDEVKSETIPTDFEDLKPTSSASQSSIGSKNSSNQNSEPDYNSSSKISDYDRLFLECLQKPIEKPSPIDGFLIRLGEGLKRLPYRERSKLELEFLTRLLEVEEQVQNHEENCS